MTDSSTDPVTGPDLLARLERYYDEVPRVTAVVEDLGPFTLFVQQRADGWPLYARPRLGAESPPGGDDVERVRARQRELGVPEAFEWVEENSPGLGEVLAHSGLTVHAYPLLVLGPRESSTGSPPGIRVEVLDAEHPDLTRVTAAIGAGFGETDTVVEGDDTEGSRQLIAQGKLRIVGAFDARGAVGGGSHSPRSGVTELMGIGVLPRARQRGVGAAITAALVADARADGATTIFLSAGSDRVAQIYGRVGFDRVGTAGIAEPGRS